MQALLRNPVKELRSLKDRLSRQMTKLAESMDLADFETIKGEDFGFTHVCAEEHGFSLEMLREAEDSFAALLMREKMIQSKRKCRK